MKKSVKFLLILMVVVLSIGVGYAAELILGSDVFYDNSETSLKASNVQDALDELYDKAESLTSCESASVPKLGNKLIPVTIASDGKVTYADTSKEWYNYCDKIWANAVILEDGASYSNWN